MSAMTVFKLEFPFEFKGTTYTEFTARRPKVRDVREFIKNLEKNASTAMEKAIANLVEIDEAVIADIDIEDYAPMKKYFEDFLQKMMSGSEES